MTDNDHHQPREKERRRTRRLALAFPIQVTGTDATGHPFCDRTVTTDVSEEGCSFDLLRPVSPGDEIQISLVSRDSEKPPESKSLPFFIVRVDASECAWAVGAEKMTPENLWHMAFPKQEHSAR